MKAPPRDSLAKRRGIVGIIRQLAVEAVSPFKGARVRGIRPGEKASTTVTLARHQEHRKVPVKLTEDGHVLNRDINAKMTEFLDARQGDETQ